VVEFRGVDGALGDDQAVELVPVRDRGDPHDGVVLVPEDLWQPDGKPGRSGDAGPSYNRLLGGAQAKPGRTAVGIRRGAIEHPARSRPDLGRLQSERSAQRFGELEEQILEWYSSRKVGAEAAHEVVRRLARPVDQLVGEIREPL